MTPDGLHEADSHVLGRRLRMAVLAVLAASVPAVVILYTARETLKPLTNRSDVQVFSLTFLSIVFEAAPFVLFGALLSGLIENLRTSPSATSGPLILTAALLGPSIGTLYSSWTLSWSASTKKIT